MDQDTQIKRIIQYKEEIDHLIHGKHHDLAQRYGLSLEQYHLLIELDELMLDVNDEGQAPKVNDLADRMNNSQNTISEKISRLEKKGYVLRVQDNADRRITRIVLSDAGRALCRQISMEANNRFFTASLSQMEPVRRAYLLQGLQELLGKMKGNMHRKESEWTANE